MLRYSHCYRYGARVGMMALSSTAETIVGLVANAVLRTRVINVAAKWGDLFDLAS